jgi:hypothetical protein
MFVVQEGGEEQPLLIFKKNLNTILLIDANVSVFLLW